jgi:hypothetical protein
MNNGREDDERQNAGAWLTKLELFYLCVRSNYLMLFDVIQVKMLEIPVVVLMKSDENRHDFTQT